MKIMSKMDLKQAVDKDGFIKIVIGETIHRCKLDETMDIIDIMRKYSHKDSYLEENRVIFRK